LRTDYIDIYYLHYWDWDTSVEEIMDALHNYVVQGKILYLVSRSWSSSTTRSHLLIPGCLQCPHLGCLSRQRVRSPPRQDSLQHLPDHVQHHGALC
jgi:aryl-alcohol dehydrogenase-like predicted oxidoreductase